MSKTLTPLDEPEELQPFTFKSSASSRVFTIQPGAIGLSDVFTTSSENDPTHQTITLHVVHKQSRVDAGDYYTINSTELLSFIETYLNNWSKSPKMASYVKVAPVHSNDPTTVLKPIDYNFIIKYIEKSIESITAKTRTGYATFDFDKYHSDYIYQQHIIICILGELTLQSSFLGIESLTNKLMAYMAIMLWNSSYIDFSKASSDEYFLKLQQKTVTDWKERNQDKVSKLSAIKSYTTGDGVETDPGDHVPKTPSDSGDSDILDSIDRLVVRSTDGDRIKN